MKVRELLGKLAGANPDADVEVSVVVEKDGEGDWSRSGRLNAVWVFDQVVCLDERRALSVKTG